MTTSIQAEDDDSLKRYTEKAVLEAQRTFYSQCTLQPSNV